MTVRHGDLSQAVDVTVDDDGRPVVASFQRWSNANPDKVHRLQPFGASISDFREVGGYRLPFRVAAEGTMPDFEVPELDPVNRLGNHVILRCGDAEIVLAHMQQGSVTVATGEVVAVGDRLIDRGG